MVQQKKKKRVVGKMQRNSNVQELFRNRACTVISAMTVTVTAMVTPAIADAFGPGFKSSWEFRSDNDRAVRSGVVDLIERKKVGMYEAPNYNINNTTNVAGDQIGCDVVSTTIGNSGSANAEGQAGAPSVLNSPAVTASSSGNIAGGETGGPLNADNGGGSSSINTSQGVDGSQQTSTVGESQQGGVTGDVGGSQSGLEQTALNDQSISASPLNSSVADSAACVWR